MNLQSQSQTPWLKYLLLTASLLLGCLFLYGMQRESFNFQASFSFHQDFGGVKCCGLTGQLMTLKINFIALLPACAR